MARWELAYLETCTMAPSRPVDDAREDCLSEQQIECDHSVLQIQRVVSCGFPNLQMSSQSE